MLSDSLFDSIHSLNEDLKHYEGSDTYGYNPQLIELIRNHLVPLRHIGGLLDAGAPDEDILEIIQRDYPIPNEKLDI